MIALARSTSAVVRNPILSLPSAKVFASLDSETRFRLSILLRDLSAESRALAEKSWRKHKAPMAAYWKAVAVYARHIALALKDGA